MTTHHLVPRLSRVHSRLPILPTFGSAGFNRLFNDGWGPAWPTQRTSARGVHGFVPRVDIDETEQEFRLRAELPGLDEGDFEVLLEADIVSIKGERKDEREDTNERYVRAESARGSFSRSFRLPFEVEPEDVKASYKNGILEVIVAKPEEAQPKVRTIPVTTA